MDVRHATLIVTSVTAVMLVPIAFGMWQHQEKQAESEDRLIALEKRQSMRRCTPQVLPRQQPKTQE